MHGRDIHQNKLRRLLTKQLTPIQGKEKNNTCFVLLMWKARTSAFKHTDKDAAAKQGKRNSSLYNLSCYEV